MFLKTKASRALQPIMFQKDLKFSGQKYPRIPSITRTSSNFFKTLRFGGKLKVLRGFDFEEKQKELRKPIVKLWHKLKVCLKKTSVLFDKKPKKKLDRKEGRTRTHMICFHTRDFGSGLVGREDNCPTRFLQIQKLNLFRQMTFYYSSLPKIFRPSGVSAY